MTTIADVQTAIENAYTDNKTLADSALERLNTALSEADTAVNSLPGVGIALSANPPNVVPAEITKPLLPTTDFSTDVKTAFDHAFGSFNSALQPQIQNYLTAFFPDIAAAVKTSSDQWIVDTIANGRFVPLAVETAIWNRAKDREVVEAARAEQEIIDATASRGFSAPTGITAFTVAATQEELAKKLTGINREITMKAFDVANDNTKFAIEGAIKLRTAFVAALGDFIKVAMVQPNNATDYAKTILAAKTGLYDNAVRLYAAQIDEARMRSQTALENNSQDLRYYDIGRQGYADFFGVEISQATLKANTAMKAAEQLGAIAAAALATRNTMTSLAGAA